MGFLGMMAGGGEALGQVADNHIKRNEVDRLLAIQQQAELDKEARTQEAARANGVIANKNEIDKENRADARAKTLRNDNFDFNTDPANVDKLAQAKVAEKRAGDAYGDSRFSTELDQKTQLHNATTKQDSALDIEEQQARIAHLTAQASGRSADGMSAGDGRLYDKYNKEIDRLNTGLADGNLTPGQSARIKLGIIDLERKKQALLSVQETAGSINPEDDYAELSTEKAPDKNASQEEANKEAEPEVSEVKPNEMHGDIKSAYDSLAPNYKKQFDDLSNTVSQGQLLRAQLSFLKSMRLIDQSVIDKTMGKGIMQKAKEASMSPAKNTRGTSRQ